jgi:hypothetical protein
MLNSPRLVATSTRNQLGSFFSRQVANHSGDNGVYFVENTERELIGVFKPEDETFSTKHGMTHGDYTAKEIAAYCLDHMGVSHVPNTKRLEIEDEASNRSRTGSFQKYVHNIGPAEDFSSSLFAIEDVQAIGLLDLRVFNTDRHMGNLVVCEEPVEIAGGKHRVLRLVPIDHSLILPDFRCLSEGWYEWCSWEQARFPITKTLEAYIAGVNIQEDCDILRELEIRSESIVTYALCTTLVKYGVKIGMTLRELANLYQRKPFDLDDPSPLETFVSSALLKCSDVPAKSLVDLTRVERNPLVIAFTEILQENLAVFGTKSSEIAQDEHTT